MLCIRCVCDVMWYDICRDVNYSDNPHSSMKNCYHVIFFSFYYSMNSKLLKAEWSTWTCTLGTYVLSLMYHLNCLFDKKQTHIMMTTTIMNFIDDDHIDYCKHICSYTLLQSSSLCMIIIIITLYDHHYHHHHHHY